MCHGKRERNPSKNGTRGHAQSLGPCTRTLTERRAPCAGPQPCCHCRPTTTVAAAWWRSGPAPTLALAPGPGRWPDQCSIDGDARGSKGSTCVHHHTMPHPRTSATSATARKSLAWYDRSRSASSRGKALEARTSMARKRDVCERASTICVHTRCGVIRALMDLPAN